MKISFFYTEPLAIQINKIKLINHYHKNKYINFDNNTDKDSLSLDFNNNNNIVNNNNHK